MRRAILHTFNAQVMGLLLGVGNSILTARMFGPEGKGEVAIFMLTLSMWVMIFGIGSSGFIYFRSRGEISISRYFVLVAVQYAFAIVAYLLALSVPYLNVAAGFLSKSRGQIYVAAFPLALGAAFIGQLASSLLISAQLFARANYSVLVSTVGVTIILISCLLLRLSATPAIEAFLIANYALPTFTSVVTVLASISEIRTDRPKREVSLRRIMSFGAKATMADFLQMLSYRADIWIVMSLLGARALGFYTLAVGLSQYLWTLPVAIASVVFPAVSKGTAEIGAIARWARVTFALSLGLAALSVPIVPSIIPMVYGRAFAPTGSAYLWLLPGAIIYVLSKVYGGYLAGRGRVTSNLIASALGCGAGITLCLILAPRFGIQGASVASSVGYIVTTMVVLATVVKLDSVGLARLTIPMRRDFKFRGSGVLAA